MFKKIKFKIFFKSISFLALFTAYCYILYIMPKSSQYAQKIITDYAAFLSLIWGYSWGCFSTNVRLDNVIVNTSIFGIPLIIKRRSPIIVLFGILLIGYIGYAMGLETTKFDISAFIFNIGTALTPIILYLCNKE